MIGAMAAVLLAGVAVWIGISAPARPPFPGPGRRSTIARNGPEAPAEPVPLVLEMCATLLESGLPIRAVLQIIGANVPGYGSLLRVSRALDLNVGWESAWGQGTGPAGELEQTLRFTQLSGAPAAALLRSSAAATRKRAVREAEARGAEFGIKLVVPLGLCALPAFIALGVVPVVLSLMPQF